MFLSRPNFGNQERRVTVILTFEIGMHARPAILVFDAEGNEIFRKIGYFEPDVFVTKLEMAKKKPPIGRPVITVNSTLSEIGKHFKHQRPQSCRLDRTQFLKVKHYRPYKVWSFFTIFKRAEGVESRAACPEDLPDCRPAPVRVRL